MSSLTLELYNMLEEKIGKEEAKKVIEVVEKSLSVIEEKVKEEKEIAKVQIKQDLLDELIIKSEFKTEIHRVEEKIEGEIRRVEEKMETLRQELKGEMKVIKLLIFFVMALMVILNQNSVEFLLKVFGFIK